MLVLTFYLVKMFSFTLCVFFSVYFIYEYFCVFVRAHYGCTGAQGGWNRRLDSLRLELKVADQCECWTPSKCSLFTCILPQAAGQPTRQVSITAPSWEGTLAFLKNDTMKWSLSLLRSRV